jgi:hypothetical protein
MNAPLGFLTCFNAYYRQSKITTERFAQQLIDREMSKEVSTHLIDGDNSPATILSHQ